MLRASRDGDLVEAAFGERAVCPVCGESVIATSDGGTLWYWVHKEVTDCDPLSGKAPRVGPWAYTLFDIDNPDPWK